MDIILWTQNAGWQEWLRIRTADPNDAVEQMYKDFWLMQYILVSRPNYPPLMLPVHEKNQVRYLKFFFQSGCNEYLVIFLDIFIKNSPGTNIRWLKKCDAHV